MKTKRKLQKGQIVLHGVFLLLMIAYIIPLLMCVSISFSDEHEMIKYGYSLIPRKFSTAAYELVFKNPMQILMAYRTNIIFTMVSTALAVLVMGLLAYPLARPNYRFKKVLNFFVFFPMLFSGGLVPSYILITKYLHLNDTMWVYILPGLVSTYSVMIIRTNYRALPYELIEAAKVDGASELFICFKIMMPLCKPVLASIGFIFFVDKWNDWMTSLLYIRKMELYSLQYLLQRILQETEYLKQLTASGAIVGEVIFPTESFRYAMAIVAAGPVLLVFPFFQKHFARGMTLGGVKG